MRNGGVNCGWDAADHKDFLRLRTQHNTKISVAFITAMARAVPLVDDIQVREHCTAYDKYLKLTQEKKELIAEYKKAKEEERIARMTKVSNKNSNLSKLNKDLALDSAVPRRNNSSAGSSRVSDLSL